MANLTREIGRLQLAVKRLQGSSPRGGVYDGLKGNGADDTIALNALFASGAKHVYIPPGTYKFTSQLTIPDYVRVEGAGGGATVLNGAFATGTAISLGVDATLEKLKVAHTTTRTSGASVVMGGNRATVSDCEFHGYFIAVSMKGASSASLIVGARVFDCNFYQPATGLGSVGIDIDNYSSCHLRNIDMTGPSSTPWPDVGIRVRHGDTLFLTDINITEHGFALLVDPQSGQSTFSLTCDHCFFDNGHNAGGTASSAALAPASGGAVKNAKFDSCWFGFADAQGMLMNPTGTVDGVEFSNCEFNDNGDSGLRVAGTNIQNWTVVGGSGAGNATAAINVSGAASDFAITGGFKAGNIAGRGVNGRGVIIQSGASDHYIITNVIARGNTTAQISDSGTGVNKVVTNNVTA